ncbi:MAG TPA: lipocalin-like domain-containing protein, partial [Candidatus Sulfotelmatobacter sp.]|nr:lipocalin-like domain-containing protein [Candidatus Sulfotelmatobacter sp.]
MLLLLAAAAFSIPPPVQAAGFREAAPGYRFSFPRDHYSHDDYRTEWWYYTGHLKTGSGDGYGFELTFFRSGLAEARANPSRWAARNLYLAHFAVSDLSQKAFTFSERMGR